jgi:hypothetical protein
VYRKNHLDDVGRLLRSGAEVGRLVVGALHVVVPGRRVSRARVVVVGVHGAHLLLVEAVQVQVHALRLRRRPAAARRVANLVVAARVAAAVAAPQQLVLDGARHAQNQQDDADGEALGHHHHQHAQQRRHHAQLVHDRQQGHLQTTLEEGSA